MNWSTKPTGPFCLCELGRKKLGIRLGICTAYPVKMFLKRRQALFLGLGFDLYRLERYLIREDVNRARFLFNPCSLRVQLFAADFNQAFSIARTMNLPLMNRLNPLFDLSNSQ
jgi:hypothetical protein